MLKITFLFRKQANIFYIVKQNKKDRTFKSPSNRNVNAKGFVLHLKYVDFFILFSLSLLKQEKNSRIKTSLKGFFQKLWMPSIFFSFKQSLCPNLSKIYFGAFQSCFFLIVVMTVKINKNFISPLLHHPFCLILIFILSFVYIYTCFCSVVVFFYSMC